MAAFARHVEEKAHRVEGHRGKILYGMKSGKGRLRGGEGNMELLEDSKAKVGVFTNQPVDSGDGAAVHGTRGVKWVGKIRRAKEVKLMGPRFSNGMKRVKMLGTS